MPVGLDPWDHAGTENCELSIKETTLQTLCIPPKMEAAKQLPISSKGV